jgi:hypothetical protein
VTFDKVSPELSALTDKLILVEIVTFSIASKEFKLFATRVCACVKVGFCIAVETNPFCTANVCACCKVIPVRLTPEDNAPTVKVTPDDVVYCIQIP